MNNKIIIKMPIPYKVWAFFINWPKEIGFSFDQLSMFQFRKNVEFDDMADGKTLEKWVKTHGNDRFYLESLYGAYESHCIHNTIKPISKEKFALGVNNCKKEELKPVIDLWNESLQYGAKKLPGKKKAKAKR